MSQPWNPDALRGVRLGSCILEESLGVGGMGAVYLARQDRPHRQVAVKVLRPQLASDPRALRVFLERFRREADAAAALDHANIVPIYEFGEDGGMAYLVMPYLADGSLAALIDRSGVLALQRASSYVDQAASALDHAHQRQLVHRDVKPSNLLLHPDGRLLLADFGIARPIDRPAGWELDDVELPDLGLFGSDGTLTQTGAAMGTPEFMAPEQVHGEPVGPAADIYALGTVAYVMLAGRTPFGGSDVRTVLTRQLVDPPLPLRSRRPDVSTSVEEVIFWALAKEPQDRPPTAGEFARALREAKRHRTLGRIFGWSSMAQEAADTAGSAYASRPVGASEPTVLVSPHLPTRTRPLPIGAQMQSSPRSVTGVDTARLSSHPIVAGASPVLDTPAAPSDATLAGGEYGGYGGFGGYVPEMGGPQWPGARARPHGPRRLNWRWLIGTICAVTAVLVLAVGIGLGSLAQSGGLGAPSATVAHVQTPHAVLPTPTATTVQTPTPPADWLSVDPDTITFGCNDGQNQQQVHLTNNGTSNLNWSSSVSPFTDRATITVSPPSGRQLHKGQSITITLTARTFIFGYSGSVNFKPGSGDAGAPATVTFSIPGCG